MCWLDTEISAKAHLPPGQGVIMWQFTSFKTAGGIHLPAIICSDAGLPSTSTAWTMNHSHLVGSLYTKPASIAVRAVPGLCEENILISRPAVFSISITFPKKSLFAEFLIERGSWFHSKVCQNHVSWSLLPPLEVTASSPPNRSRVERKHLSPKPTMILGFETAATLDLQESFRRRPWP